MFGNLFGNLKGHLGANDKKFLTSEAKAIAADVSSRIKNYEVAKQFVLEELDAARQGNEYAQSFVKESGFEPNEYINAMERSFDEVDGPDGPQQTLLRYIRNRRMNDAAVELRVRVVKLIMFKWKLGLYAETSNESENLKLIDFVEKVIDKGFGPFDCMNEDIGVWTDKYPTIQEKYPLIFMASQYARRSAIAVCYLQGLCDRDGVEYVEKVFKATQIVCRGKTNGSTSPTTWSFEQQTQYAFQEEAMDQGYELIKSYTDLFTKKQINLLTAVVVMEILDRPSRIKVGESWNEVNEVYDSFCQIEDKLSQALKNQLTKDNEFDSDEI